MWASNTNCVQNSEQHCSPWATTATDTLLAMIAHSAVQSSKRYHSQCYYVHRHLNNVWHNNAHSLIGKPHLVTIASNEESYTAKIFCEKLSIGRRAENKTKFLSCFSITTSVHPHYTATSQGHGERTKWKCLSNLWESCLIEWNTNKVDLSTIFPCSLQNKCNTHNVSTSA